MSKETHLFQASESIKKIPVEARKKIRKLPKDKLKFLRKEFLSFDTNGDAVLSVEEFKRLMLQEDTYSDQDVEMAVALCDRDGNGKIDFAEFLAIVVSDDEGNPRSDQFSADELFDMIDRNKDGKVTLGELKTGFAMVGCALSDDQLSLLWAASGADDKKGTLNKESFSKLLEHLGCT